MLRTTTRSKPDQSTLASSQTAGRRRPPARRAPRAPGRRRRRGRGRSSRWRGRSAAGSWTAGYRPPRPGSARPRRWLDAAVPSAAGPPPAAPSAMRSQRAEDGVGRHHADDGARLVESRAHGRSSAVASAPRTSSSGSPSRTVHARLGRRAPRRRPRGGGRRDPAGRGTAGAPRRRARRSRRPSRSRGARAGSTGSASCSRCPPRRNTAIRSASRTASSMSCVTSMTVVPSSRRIRPNSVCSRRRPIGSTAPNGSSMSSTGGSAASARATPTRCRSPPDSWCGYRRA